MAQAARLSLRMQKELKLLLTDPPPGASFPHLSPDSDLSSSSSSLLIIDAQIKGPEGTVYDKGVFNVKIQVPERYPFQPPIVTFATPIYHPNIDNGGRICLDILNLPPKGAWQPSLNISTVLTSIGLLLSEPNPDDGLMCEASREYKYNRQAFDQKARSMTEKYAHPEASGNFGGSGCVQSNSNPSMMEFKTPEIEVKREANDIVLNCKKICGISRKLRLESLGPSQERVGDEEGLETSNSHLLLKDSGNQMEGEGTNKEEKHMIPKSNLSRERLTVNRRKLTLEVFGQCQKRNDNGKENVVQNHISSDVSENFSVASLESLMPQDADCHKEELHGCQNSIPIDDNINVKAKKLRGFKQPLESSGAVDVSKGKMLETSQALTSATHPYSLDEAAFVTPALNNFKPQARKDFKDIIEKPSLDRKFCSVGRKLSLGLRGSSEPNKENVEPAHKRPNISMALSMSTAVLPAKDEGCESGLGNQHERGQKQSLFSPAQLEESNNNNHIQQLPHSRSLFSSSKSITKQHNNVWAKKQCPKQGQNDEQQEAEEESLISEAVIVLDSEDSEEEKSMPLRSKPLLARKRLGKWKLRA